MIGGGLVVFCLLFCTACATRAGWVKADGSSGYVAIGVGHKEGEVTQGADSYTAAEVSTEQGFRDLRIAAQTVSIGGNLAKLGESGRKAYSASQVTKRGATSAAAATDQARIAADVQKTAILNPAPE
jgi:hypothetical protein